MQCVLARLRSVFCVFFVKILSQSCFGPFGGSSDDRSRNLSTHFHSSLKWIKLQSICSFLWNVVQTLHPNCTWCGYGLKSLLHCADEMSNRSKHLFTSAWTREGDNVPEKQTSIVVWEVFGWALPANWHSFEGAVACLRAGCRAPHFQTRLPVGMKLFKS